MPQRSSPISPSEAIRTARALHGQGRVSEAAHLYQQVLQVQPSNGEIMADLGRLYLMVNAFAEAETWLRAALGVFGTPVMMMDLGAVLDAQGKSEEALPFLFQAAALLPKELSAHINLVSVLRHLGRYAEAEEALGKARAIDPNHAFVLLESADLDRELGRNDAAFASLKLALKLHPGNPMVRDRMAMAFLARGEFQQGWPLYEGRRQSPAHPCFPRPGQPPIWDGSLRPGLNLLMLAEQGIGDVLQFIRFLRPLWEAGVKLRFEVPPQQSALQPLLEAQGWPIALGFGSAVPPPIDALDSLLSLPLRLDLRMETVTGEPYLKADPARVQAWAERLERLTPRQEKLRVGIAWAGSALHPNDAQRSLPPEALAPLFSDPRIAWVSLQKELGRFGRRPAMPDTRWTDPTEWLTDYGETAALLSNLDAMVCVDTGVGHLAGALGIPTLLMLPVASEWRWFEHRSDSPWYSGHQLFRQTSPGDWATVVGEVADALKNFLIARETRPR